MKLLVPGCWLLNFEPQSQSRLSPLPLNDSRGRRSVLRWLPFVGFPQGPSLCQRLCGQRRSGVPVFLRSRRILVRVLSRMWSPVGGRDLGDPGRWRIEPSPGSSQGAAVMRNSLFSPIQSCSSPPSPSVSHPVVDNPNCHLSPRLPLSSSPAVSFLPFSFSFHSLPTSCWVRPICPQLPRSLNLWLLHYGLWLLAVLLHSSLAPYSQLSVGRVWAWSGPLKMRRCRYCYHTVPRCGQVASYVNTPRSCRPWVHTHTHTPIPTYSFTFSHSRGPNCTCAHTHIHTHTWCSGAKGQCARGRAVIIVLTLRSGVARLCQVKCQEKQYPWDVRMERNGQGCLNPHSFQRALAFPPLQTDQSPLTTAASLHAHTLAIIDTHSLIQHADMCMLVEMDRTHP